MTTATPPVVRTIADITPDWLTAALRDSGRLTEGRVVDVDAQPVGTGQMGKVLRLALTYDAGSESGARGAPSSLIAKVASDDAAARAAGKAMGFYEAEVRFYREVAPRVGALTPGCLAASYDRDDGAFTLLLEDRSDLRVGDMVAGGTPADAALALAALTTLQAPTWNDPALAAADWLSPAGWRAMSQTFPTALQPFLTRFGSQLTDDEVALIERVLPQAVPWLDAWSGPTVVQHGDYRLDNMLFDDGSSAVTVFDWQTARVGPPLVDVGFYLGGCLSIEDRREHGDDLLRDYHQRLAASGIDGYSWDDVRRDYVRYVIYGLIAFVGTFIHSVVTPRGEDLYLTAFRRYAQQTLDAEN